MPFHNPNIHFSALHTRIYLVKDQCEQWPVKPDFNEKPEAEIQARVMPCRLTFWGPNEIFGANCPETTMNFEPCTVKLI